MMNGLVYKLYWEKLPYHYFGSTGNFKKRVWEHFDKMKKGSHTNKRVQVIYEFFGFPKFEIIAYCELSMARYLERELIAYGKNKRNCCNIKSRMIHYKSTTA